MTRHPLESLATHWHALAKQMQDFGAAESAAAVDRCASDLEERLAVFEDELLSYDQAAEESGYSVSHLRRLVREAVLVDRVTEGPTMLRRGDLPKKPASAHTNTYAPLRTA